MTDAARAGSRLTSTVTSGGTLRIALQGAQFAAPGAGEVLVEMRAAPINPSDLGLMLGPVDPNSLRRGQGGAEGDLPPESLVALKGRLDRDLPVGFEGAGTVIAAGEGAEALVGRLVAVYFGSTFATHALVRAADVMVLPEGTAPRDGASALINPLTVLGMIETMRANGHRAIVHTAAASNLGRMLNRLCQRERIALVNIVRTTAQAALLRNEGARHVLNSSVDGFGAALEEAVAETGATVAFDAIGGGDMASTILTAMERAQSRTMTTYTRYGSPVEKRVYIYGALDTGPTVLSRAHGFAWSVGGWLLPNFLAAIGPEAIKRLHGRVTAELTTTFASQYKTSLALSDLTDPDTLRDLARKGTGGKAIIERFA